MARIEILPQYTCTDSKALMRMSENDYVFKYLNLHNKGCHLWNTHYGSAHLKGVTYSVLTTLGDEAIITSV